MQQMNREGVLGMHNVPTLRKKRTIFHQRKDKRHLTDFKNLRLSDDDKLFWQTDWKTFPEHVPPLIQSTLMVCFWENFILVFPRLIQYLYFQII